MRLPTRVCDYFCIVDLDPESISDEGLHAKVTQRFPERDHNDAEFPRLNDLPMFCHPSNLATSENRGPHLFTLVFTEANGARVYICILKYWEKLSDATISKLNDKGVDLENKLYFPTCLVLTSHWSFYRQHAKFLLKFHEMVKSKTLSEIPIERYLCNYIYEIPLPPRGKINVVATLFKERFEFRRPEPNKAPLIPFSLERLFRQLSADNIALIITAILTEKRMLFVSSHVDYLNECIESLASLIYPFFWRHIYIPLLPRKLIDFICAPMPFMCGILKDYMPREEVLLEGVVVVDLDLNTINEHHSDPIPPVPSKLKRYFRNRFKDSDQPFGNARIPSILTLESHVREDVLKFTAKTMRGYQNYMNPQTEDIKAKFNKTNFINSFTGGDSERGFYEEFLETQLFQCFVDDRFDADGGHVSEILYFDETISTYQEGHKPTPFLTAETWAHKETFQVPFATDDGLDDGPFSYGKYPVLLNHNNVGKPRIPEMLVSAEDLGHARRQAAFDDIAIEFFSQKRLYDRVRNSLQARVRIQNKQFNSIHDYFRKYMSFRGTHMSNLAQTLHEVSKPKDATTTYEVAIGSLRDFIQKTYQHEKTEFENSRENLNSLYESIMVTPHKCVAYFESFKEWERETSQRKVLVESAKNRCIKSTQQYEQKVREFVKEKEVDILGRIPEERVDVISDALCRRDQHTFQYVEAATAFLYILGRYKKRTPQLLTDVHEVSKKRLETFKLSMQRFVRDRRRNLKAQLDELEKLGAVADAIDCDKDLQEFLAKLKKEEPQAAAPDWVDSEKGAKVTSHFSQQVQAHGFDFPTVKEKMQKKFPDITHMQVTELWEMFTQNGAPIISPSFPMPPPKRHSAKYKTADTTSTTSSDMQTGLKDAQFRRSNSVENLRRLSQTSASLGKLLDSPNLGPRHSTLSAVDELSTSHLSILHESIRETTYSQSINEEEVEGADPLDDMNYYSINLWGNSGRNAIVEQNSYGRETLKDLVTMSENLVMIWQKKGDSLVRLAVPTKFSRLNQTEGRAWKHVMDHSHNQGRYYSEMIETLKNMKRHLKISRKELSKANSVMQQQIDIGEKNADISLKQYEQRFSEQSTCKRSLAEKQSTYQRLSERESGWGRVRPVYVDYLGSNRKYESAESLCQYSKHVMRAIRDTRDICTAVILDSYHDKEKKRQLTIQRALASFVDSFFRMVSEMHKENEVLKAHFDNLSPDQVLKEHYCSKYTRRARSKPNLDRIYNLEERKVLAVRVDDGIAQTEPWAKQSMDYLNTLYTFLEKRIETEKAEMGRLLQVPWQVKAPYKDTLSDSLICMRELMTTLVNHIGDFCHRTPKSSPAKLRSLHQEYEQYVSEVRTVLRAKNMDFNSKGTSLLACLKKLKAMRDNKARLLSSLRQRRETDRPARFWQNSERQLEANLRDCEIHINSLEKEQKRSSSHLAQLNHDRLSIIDLNVKNFKDLERRKVEIVKKAVSQYAHLHDTLILQRCDDALKQLQDYALRIDPDENLKEFVRVKNDPQTIPKEVRKQLKAQHLSFIKAPLNSQMVVKEKLRECLKFPDGAFENSPMAKQRSNTTGGGKHARNHSDRRAARLRGRHYNRHASDDTILSHVGTKSSLSDTKLRSMPLPRDDLGIVSRSQSGEIPRIRRDASAHRSSGDITDVIMPSAQVNLKESLSDTTSDTDVVLPDPQIDDKPCSSKPDVDDVSKEDVQSEGKSSENGTS